MSETILDENGSLKKEKNRSKQKKRKLFFSAPKKVKCEICSAKLKSRGILDSHMRTHSDNKKFRCEICSKEFRRKDHLTMHLPTHFRGYGLTKQDFASMPLNALSLQYKPIVKTKEFRCTICSKVCRNNYHLRNHISAHSYFRPYCCQICQKAYKTRDHLRQHFNSFHPDCREYYMEYVYIDETNMMNTFDGKKYQCDICMKGFNFKDSVRLHLFAHFGLKKYECKICWKRFPNASQLRKHLQIHLPPAKQSSCKEKVQFDEQGLTTMFGIRPSKVVLRRIVYEEEVQSDENDDNNEPMTCATQLTVCKEEIQFDEDEDNEHMTHATQLTVCKEEVQIDEQGWTTMFNIRSSKVVLRRI